MQQAGDHFKACEIMNEARLLDLQDRFINSKSTKYYLRTDQVNQAEDVVGLFAKVVVTATMLAMKNLLLLRAGAYAFS